MLSKDTVCLLRTVLLIPVTGTLIRRHRIPLPPPDDNMFYNVHHFNINQQMVLYSRPFTITDCDSFTRNFLTKLGVRLNAPASVPPDPYSNLREQVGRESETSNVNISVFSHSSDDTKRLHGAWSTSKIL